MISSPLESLCLSCLYWIQKLVNNNSQPSLQTQEHTSLQLHDVFLVSNCSFLFLTIYTFVNFCHEGSFQ